jgi:hypothetical protein
MGPFSCLFLEILGVIMVTTMGSKRAKTLGIPMGMGSFLEKCALCFCPIFDPVLVQNLPFSVFFLGFFGGPNQAA